jgi:hypothetical protein
VLMVIFGAGASFDSVSPRNRSYVSDDEFMPPVASQLFERRGVFDGAVLRHPTMWPVIDRLRHIPPDRYVEAVLEEIKDEAETFPINFNYLASLQFYLREVIYSTTREWQRTEAAGATNYSTLMGMLYEWRIRHQDEQVVLVSFNYDCLLDDARIPFSGSPVDLYGYIAADFPLLKPHGSVNWFVEVAGLERGSGSASYDPGSQTLIDAAPWDVTDKYHVVPGSGPDLFIGQQWIAPVIAIPVEKKAVDSFSFPSSHLDYLREIIPEVSRLLIIGWAGRENHFHDLWKGAGAKVEQLVVVAGSLTAAEDVLNNLLPQDYWTNVTRRSQFERGFSEFVEDRNRLEEMFR